MKSKYIRIGSEEQGLAMDIPTGFLLQTLAPDGEPLEPSDTPIESFRELLLMKIGVAIDGAIAGKDDERVKQAQRVFSVIHLYIDRVDIYRAGRGGKDVRLQYSYKQYAMSKATEEAIDRMTVEALSDPIVKSAAISIWPFIRPQQKTRTPRPPKLKPAHNVGRFPTNVAKELSRGRKDLFYNNDTEKDLLCRKIDREIRNAVSDVHRQALVQRRNVIVQNENGKELESRHYRMLDAIVQLVGIKGAYITDVADGEVPQQLDATIWEVAQVFTGRTSTGGSGIRQTIETLEEMAEGSLWPRSAIETSIPTAKGRHGRRVYDVQPLVQLVPGEYFEEEDGVERIVGGAPSILVHPAFVYHLMNAGQFALTPLDLVERMRDAWGKPRGEIIAAAYKLRYILMGAVARGHDTHTEYAANLFPYLFPRYWAEKRKDLMQKQFTEAVETLTRLGLVVSAEKEDRDGRGILYTFNLNRDWYKMERIKTLAESAV